MTYANSALSLRNLTAPILLCASLAACGDSSTDPELTASQAQQALRATSTEVQVGLDEYRSSGGAGEVAVTCSGGGTATYDGSADVTVDPIEVNVSTNVDMQGCTTSSGLVMDGSIAFTQGVLVGDTVRVETVFDGTIDYSGTIEGTCDVNVTVVVDTTGKLVSVTGETCGHDAADFDIVISPYWSR